MLLKNNGGIDTIRGCVIMVVQMENCMVNFIAGCILGFAVASIGFTGIAQQLDKVIDTAKNVSVKVDSGK